MLKIDREGQETVVLAAVGEIDLSNATQLEDAIVTELTADAVSAVDVDLSGVTFMDSAGLRALVAGWRTASENGKSLVVSRPQRSVRRVLDITGLTGVFGL